MGETKSWLEILSLLSQLGKNFPELGMLPASHKPTFQAVALITIITQLLTRLVLLRDF